jgi:hypothetical protein
VSKHLDPAEALIGFLDAWSGVVSVPFSKISRVDYDSAFDTHLDYLVLLDIECLAFVLVEVNVHHG